MSNSIVGRSLLQPRVRRALLYLQGYDMKKILKVANHPTLDCACLDMEDGVGIHRKDDARDGIVNTLQQKIKNEINFGRTECLVRINAFDNINEINNDLAIRDLDAIILDESSHQKQQALPDGIVIPKVENAYPIEYVSDRLDNLGDIAINTRIIAMIESPTSILNMKEICTASQHRLDGLIFGADDYASAIGATRTKQGNEMDFARNMILMQASAYNISCCIDMVQIDYNDSEQLQNESQLSFKLGYTGKQVIHPKQIDIVQKEYSPSLQSIQYAAEIVKANQQHQQNGHGAFAYNGKMIDMPTVKQCENLLQRAILMGLCDTEQQQ